MRALLIILDSLATGSSPDAARYGDQGADTLGHLFACNPDLELPTLFSLGLGEIIKSRVFDPPARKCDASYGRMRERSSGKDTITGHWEIAGAFTDTPFTTFEHFPDELLGCIGREANVEFIGNYRQSSSAILDELGEEHLHTGKPILYTSADSVMQVAAHEAVLPLARLYQVCRIARRHCDDWRIGRVIARPFTGENGCWKPSPGRHDYSIVPPRTVLNAISERGLPVEGIGKVSEIFAGSGITRSHPTGSNAETLEAIEEIWRSPQSGMIFANLADCDALYGHRRNPAGYARALEQFDDWLGEFLQEIESDDLLIITGDHGNDPTFHGSDHTREDVPVLVRYDGRTGPLGIRDTFADVAATLGEFFGIDEPQEPWRSGKPLITFHRPQGFAIGL